MFTLKHKAFFGISIYVILFLHVYILFPDLPVLSQLFQALLRLLVLIFSIASTYVLYNSSPSDKLKFFKWFFWLMLIPYPVYNIFQVRHIAEIFSLQHGEHFAPGPNVDFIWKCLPTLAYSFISGIIGFSCIYSIAKKYFASALKQYLFAFLIISVCLSAGLYGLHSRLDTYHLLTHTILVYKDLVAVFSSAEAILNFVYCTVFLTSCYVIFTSFVKHLFPVFGSKFSA